MSNSTAQCLDKRAEQGFDVLMFTRQRHQFQFSVGKGRADMPLAEQIGHGDVARVVNQRKAKTLRAIDRRGHDGLSPPFGFFNGCHRSFLQPSGIACPDFAEMLLVMQPLPSSLGSWWQVINHLLDQAIAR
jgi:hypothetical protein